MVAAGGYVIVRARAREMAVARLQSDFVTAVSHEFRTPLTALIQFNDLLEASADLPPEKKRAYLHAQRRATERLQRLVESLLDFGRMEAGRRMYAMEPLDAALLVRDVVADFQRQTETRGLTIHFASDAAEQRVDADPEALARAIWNLLDNAVKYSGDSRDIHVAVRGGGSGVAITVRDQGIGIPAAEQSRIFQKFTRGAAASSKRIRGTGVGLAMVQHIVAGHRGTLNVESIEGQGSTFMIVLPNAATTRPSSS
jgi:signal transduction histidine kinase